MTKKQRNKSKWNERRKMEKESNNAGFGMPHESNISKAVKPRKPINFTISDRGISQRFVDRRGRKFGKLTTGQIIVVE